MLKKQAIRQSGLTKKAVEYYIDAGLIAPTMLENGYRDFTPEDVERLKTIALYRKLGLSLAEIKSILCDRQQLQAVLYSKTLELEKEKVRLDLLQRLSRGESLASVQQEIEQIDSASVIRKRLTDLFPGDFGKFISFHFAPYLTGTIDTPEQMVAFQEIIEFFDQAPDLDLPEELRQYLDTCLEMVSPEQMTHVQTEKNKAMENIDAFMADHEQMLEQYLSFKQSEDYQNLPAVRLMEHMKQICAANGYNDRFIPAMRRLSPLYDQYYTQLLAANQRFLEKYPQAD